MISRSASYPSHAYPPICSNVPRPGLTGEQQIQTAEILCRAQQGHEDGDGVGWMLWCRGCCSDKVLNLLGGRARVLTHWSSVPGPVTPSFMNPKEGCTLVDGSNVGQDIIALHFLGVAHHSPSCVLYDCKQSETFHVSWNRWTASTIKRST